MPQVSVKNSDEFSVDRRQKRLDRGPWFTIENRLPNPGLLVLARGFMAIPGESTPSLVKRYAAA